MSTRLKAIGLYGKRPGQLRTLDFATGGLTAISGKQARGKSAVLDVVEYCLLSRQCPIAKGVIRDHVSHVGAVFEKDDEAFTIIRALPGEGRATSEEISIRRGQVRELPAIVPASSWNLETAREALSEFIGIEAVPTLGGSARTPLDSSQPANVRHCAPFLFQPQDVIAGRQVIFPGIDDSFKKRDVSDALYYFLRILTQERVANRHELRGVRQELNRLARARAELEALRSRGYERGVRLWNEAVVLGIVPRGDEPATAGDLLQALRRVAQYAPPSQQLPPEMATISAVQAEEATLRASHRRIMDELGDLRRFTEMSDDQYRRGGLQLERLKLRDLLPNGDAEQTCPLCLNGTLSIADMLSDLERAVPALDESIATPRRLQSKIQQEVRRLETEGRDTHAKLRLVQDRLRALLTASQQWRTVLAEIRAREQLVGRVIEYVSSFSVPADDSAASRVLALQDRARQLEREVGDAALRRLREAAEEALGGRITTLASQLDVEFPGHAVRLDLRELMIRIQFGEQWIPLNELGSGANWLGYHVATAVALQEELAARSSPVPQFLLLDQPSQAWFPAGLEGTHAPKGKDREFEAVRRVYRFLREAAARPGGPQIIVVDHAGFNEPGIAPKYNWHGEEALVPPEWRA